jgi:hypothetical protein
MLTAGTTHAGGVDLLGLLESVVSRKDCPAGVRVDARRLVEGQRGSA